MARAALLLACLVVASGCLGAKAPPVSPDASVDTFRFAHLSAAGAKVVDTEATRSFVWEGLVGPGGSVSLVGAVPNTPVNHLEYQVDGTVGYLELFIRTPSTDVQVVAMLRDSRDRVACGAAASSIDGSCTAPVAANETLTTYDATVRSYGASNDVPSWLSPRVHQGDLPFQLEVKLHPREHLTFGAVEGLAADQVFRVSDTGSRGGEPTLGVSKKGTIFAIESTNLMRSRDDGKTWQNVKPPTDATTLDPMMYLDPWTGRVYTSHLYVGCSTLSWSDNEGDTWITNPAACGMPYDDHQKLCAGGHLLPASAYPSIVYYTFAHFEEGLWVSRSLDGGATFTSTMASSDTIDREYDYRTGGPCAADRAGNVYVPSFLAKNGLGVVVSHDHGANFESKIIAKNSIGKVGIDPGIAIDAAGNAFVSYEGTDGYYVVASKDKGETWSAPMQASPKGLTAFMLGDATAGDAGRVAVAYLATADSGPVWNSNLVPGWSRWHLYVSATEDAFATEPMWTTTRATPEADPVQIGTICTGGIGCFGGNRNLLDFIDVQTGPDGRVYAAYTDGCLAGCVELPQDSRGRQGIVAIQDAGIRLFQAKAPWA